MLRYALCDFCRTIFNFRLNCQLYSPAALADLVPRPQSCHQAPRQFLEAAEGRYVDIVECLLNSVWNRRGVCRVVLYLTGSASVAM